MEETDIALMELIKRGSLFWKNLDEQEKEIFKRLMFPD